MSSPSTPDGELDPFDGTQDDSGLRYFRGVDPTLRETSASGSSGRQEWTGMGSWRIRGKLGAGGEAELFVVGRDGGEVAILKAYVFEDGEAERQPVMPDPEVLDAIRDLACPGLVRILEHGIAAEGGCLAGRYCEVMEECEGQIQTQHWDDEAELLALVGQVTRALQALHSRRIAHRDVKPTNILIGGTTERVYKLGDYGIATFANRRSRLGRRDASPMYASPAQLSGLVSMTDDWWSLGMIVQESLMGRHPHAGKSPAEIQRSYVTQEFRPQVPRAVSDRWKPLLEGLLDYDPEKRWSHEEVLRWCEGGLAGTPPIGGGRVGSETSGWLRRAWLFLEDGEFESAKEYAERVLDREPETGEAYWVKALAGLGMRRESDLLEHQHTLSGNGDYQKALRFGTAGLRPRLEGIEEDIQRRLLLAAEAREAQERAKAKAEADKHAKAKAEADERYRQAEEARQKAEAEERENPGLAAEAKMASMLGISRPFESGARGQAGGLVVRWIPAGWYRMGSLGGEEGRNPDEVEHEVVLTRGFFMAETECTQAQWQAVMGSNPSEFKGANRPVDDVSWNEAVEYCRKLTTQQRTDGVLQDGWEWRLPTEGEWEYAARAGTMGRRYGELDAIGWYDGNSASQTHPVSQKAANAWGLYDMLGNVWEWCSDWSGDYPTGSVTDPMGPSSGSNRVFRGGGWYNGARFARSAFRLGFVPGDRYFFLGFRPVFSSVR